MKFRFVFAAHMAIDALFFFWLVQRQEPLSVIGTILGAFFLVGQTYGLAAMLAEDERGRW